MSEEMNREISTADICAELAGVCLDYSGGDAEGVFAELSFMDAQLSCGVLFAVNQGLYDMESLSQALPGCDCSEEAQTRFTRALMEPAGRLEALLRAAGDEMPDVIRVFSDTGKSELNVSIIPKADKELYADEERAAEDWIEEINAFMQKGEEYMKFNEKLVPLGSVVLLKGGVQKIIIIARGIQVLQGGKTVLFDYGGVLYPEGLTGDQMAYFNRDSIEKVYFLGYNDEENRAAENNIETYIAQHPEIIMGDVHNPDIGV